MTPGFYVTGGTLGIDTPSYVPRDADEQLYQALAEGEFCYVLTSRQMGKSSLMVRAAARLRDADTRVAVIDLTAIGVNVTAEQWYEGLLLRLGRQLGSEEELEAFADEHRHLNPLQRWLLAIESIVLGRSQHRVVVFIDEIDLVRSLPFSADEFFAALRQCYNRRSEDERWHRISFCLLGVATPSDLISDHHITPFNVGTRIELRDFRSDEATVLTAGLGKKPEHAARLLARVLHWTAGHPYLTQRLCSIVAGDDTVDSEQEVDRICRAAFLAPGARDQDDNLIFVRERILRSETDAAAVLDLYREVRRGQVVSDNNSSVVETLKLSGIVRSRAGQLHARNRIYEAAFDVAWIRANMPDAELRRQRAAFYHGLMRAASIAAVIVLLLGGACAFAFYQWLSVGEALRMAQVSELIAHREHEKATDANQAMREAFVREQQQRVLAEDRELEATRLRQEAQQREREAEQLRDLAESRRRTAEENYKVAVENYRKMQLAYQQLTAERRSVEERGKLFLAFPQWLQAYSAEAVAAYAQSQIEAGQPTDALKTYAEFCDLALSDDEGFWTRELVRIDPQQLQQLDLDVGVLATRIQVKPIDIVNKVLEPGIALGEQEQKQRASRESESLLASLYDSQARLLFQQPDLDTENEDRLGRVVQIYDRAIELDNSRPHFFVGRAVARFMQDGNQLDLVQADLKSAMTQYPTRVEPPTDNAGITDAHRDLALIQNGLGNIAELQADASPSSAAALLDEALSHHQAAAALNPSEIRYAIALARVRRKTSMQMPPAKQQAVLKSVVNVLEQAGQLDAENARLHNELGETHLALNNLEEARRQFDLAVRFGDLLDSAVNRYRYYCNQANAYWRIPTTVENLRQALGAAELAVKLRPDDASDAFYYRGLALWSLANLTENVSEQARQLDQAVAAFETALAQDEEHAGAILGRCQLLLERQDRPIDEEQNQQLLADATRALTLAASRADQAKAHYVRGLALVRRFVDTQQELPLVDALEALLAAGQASVEYVPLVRDYFDHAMKRTWAAQDLQSRASRLSAAFNDLESPDR
ncbi:MAG: AAA-like domain-containing protein [Planctomycetota bacterium]|nr:AAA-like domain-containing protein [Planctomycetota bacterium]